MKIPKNHSWALDIEFAGRTTAALGTRWAFREAVMADQPITLETGATLDAKTLDRILAVERDNLTIVRPALSGKN